MRRRFARVSEGPNACDQIAFCAFHLFLVEVQTNAGYMRRMRNNNLEIRYAGSSCRLQLLLLLLSLLLIYFIYYKLVQLVQPVLR